MCGQSVRHPEKHTRTFCHVDLGLENTAHQAGGELLVYMINSTHTHTSLVCLQERLLHAKEPCRPVAWDPDFPGLAKLLKLSKLRLGALSSHPPLSLKVSFMLAWRLSLLSNS